jgi:hypothetical protein
MRIKPGLKQGNCQHGPVCVGRGSSDRETTWSQLPKVGRSMSVYLRAQTDNTTCSRWRAIQSLFGVTGYTVRQNLVAEIKYWSAYDCTQYVLVQGLCLVALQGPAYSGRRGRAGLRVGNCRMNTCSNTQVLSVAYRRGRGFGRLNTPPPSEISKFWQSWAEFPVPWNIHP